MKVIGFIALIAGLSGTGMAVAQSGSPLSSAGGMYLKGYIGLGYYDLGGGDNSGFFRLDADTGMRPSDGMGLGFNLGVEALGDDTDTYSALYPTVSYGTQFGTFSVGVPRFLLDRDYLPEYHFANVNYVDQEFRLLWGSISGSRYLFASNDTPYGLRYDGVFGNTKVGATYHHYDNSNVDVYSAAIRNEQDMIGSFEQVAFFAGVEHLRSTSSDITSFRVGAEGRTDKLTTGILYSDVGFPLDSSGGALYAEYRLMDNLILNGSLAHIHTSTDITFIGGGVEYRFLNEKAYAKASVLRSDDSGADTTWEASVGFRF